MPSSVVCSAMPSFQVSASRKKVRKAAAAASGEPRSTPAGAGLSDAAVDNERRADDVVAGARREVDRGAGHVVVAADAPRRDALGNLVAVVAGGAVHVGGEGAGRDGADDDVVLRQAQRHAPR